MKCDVDKVWDMECKEFFLRLKHMEAILAEDRYIKQRQLDNHIKAKHSKSVNSFSEIYEEFALQMKQIGKIKINNINLTKEEMKQKHKMNLAKMGFKR